MKKPLIKQLVITGIFVTLTGVSALGQITPTNLFTSFYDSSSTYNGEPLVVGSIVKAYDQSGVLCGMDTVHTSGSYGFMPVYGDDPLSPEDEGADDGELIDFEINGRAATVVSGDNTFTDQTLKPVRLSASATSIGIELVDPPTSKAATFLDTVRFEIGIRNTGDGLDFYGVSAVNSNAGFSTLPQDTDFYAAPDEIIYVYFEIETPLWIPDTADMITYTVYSKIDTTVNVTGDVDLFLSITDVDDGDDAVLPGGFSLHQNYPNPFNPTTTITFALPFRSSVELQIINILGRFVKSRDLGHLPAGEHEIEFDASDLSSGVYLYRVVTEEGSLTRKMLLLK